MPPRLTFFCELPDPELTALVRSPGLLERLRRLEAGVSLAILRFTRDRADAVRRLHDAGIPVTAWFVLPEDRGYWLHAGNADDAWNRYDEFLVWSRRQTLRWARVGLDIEPDIADVRAVRRNTLNILPLVGRRILQNDVEGPRRIYQRLVDAIRADGYAVDAYVVPLIHTERELGTSVLQRVSGILDLDVDREIPMLYSSFVRPDGAGFLDHFAPHFDALAVGVTGGGVEEGIDPPPPLTWGEFERDLRLARRHTDEIHVFSLEGCADRGWLDRLVGFDWTEPPPPIGEAAERAGSAVRRMGRLMRVLDRPRRLLGAVAVLAVGIGGWVVLRRRS